MARRRICPQCDKVLSTSSALHRHIRNIHGSEEHRRSQQATCDRCHVTYHNIDSLNKHIAKNRCKESNRHRGETTCPVLYCFVNFDVTSGRELSHQRNDHHFLCHRVPAQYPWVCVDCGRRYRRGDFALQHNKLGFKAYTTGAHHKGRPRSCLALSGIMNVYTRLIVYSRGCRVVEQPSADILTKYPTPDYTLYALSEDKQLVPIGESDMFLEEISTTSDNAIINTERTQPPCAIQEVVVVKPEDDYHHYGDGYVEAAFNMTESSSISDVPDVETPALASVPKEHSDETISKPISSNSTISKRLIESKIRMALSGVDPDRPIQLDPEHVPNIVRSIQADIDIFTKLANTLFNQACNGADDEGEEKMTLVENAVVKLKEYLFKLSAYSRREKCQMNQRTSNLSNVQYVKMELDN